MTSGQSFAETFQLFGSNFSFCGPDSVNDCKLRDIQILHRTIEIRGFSKDEESAD